MGVRPPGFEVFCDQQELFHVTSKALFCILQVWQDFIRDVFLRLLSHYICFLVELQKKDKEKDK